jgi:hypothetical protein
LLRLIFKGHKRRAKFKCRLRDRGDEWLRECRKS